MTQSEALALADDLHDLAALRKNRFFARRLLPYIERVRDEHRVGMRDPKLPPHERCEHVTAWEEAQSILDFPSGEEQRLRRLLTEHDRATGTLERPFSREPV